ncbi:hypothetical protein ABE527_02310 [Brucella sp. TWI432]
MTKKSYTVNADGFIHGAGRKKDESLLLSDREAKYLVMSGLISVSGSKNEPAVVGEPSPTTLDKKTR